MGRNHIYVLGTGVSHNGSVCLLKDGKISVAIEKERITRKKHDGGNDTAAIRYCLEAEGITFQDLDLIVQNSTSNDHFNRASSSYISDRLINSLNDVPVVTISHHLAHAYSTIGTCPFNEFGILIIDGNGSPYNECIDIEGSQIDDLVKIKNLQHWYWEKDSYYQFKDNRLNPVYKDFSEIGSCLTKPMHPQFTYHTIGGFYSAASFYCFGGMDDVGKLMGLAPYGRPGVFSGEIFDLRDNRLFLNYDWMSSFQKPVKSFANFKNDFQYYADVALWVQKEAERAIKYIVSSRINKLYVENLCYAGGVALNAVANTNILGEGNIKNLYIEPAAGDNGIAIGCAYYGWMEVLKKERIKHNGSTCFGFEYPKDKILETILSHTYHDPIKVGEAIDLFFRLITKGYYKSPPKDLKSSVCFNILNYGKYYIEIKDGVIKRIDPFENPTCIINIHGIHFYKGILDTKFFKCEEASQYVECSNYQDLEILLTSVDWGQIAEVLNKEYSFENTSTKVKYTYAPRFIEQTAKLLASGKTIGWFQDGCEFGPRALGRRSILADPRNIKVRDFINSEIKFREDFRPFAPSVLLEDVNDYFKTERESPYMIMVDQVREEWSNKIKSIVHQDGSCRIQTVSESWNPKYYKLLHEFKKNTGISVLLNTSFNRRSMPIVETPQQALDFFYSCKLDYLVIDKYIIEK